MKKQKLTKIIHQIWSGVEEPLPQTFKVLSNTWKRDYPDWEYILWDNKMMNEFLEEHYPQYIDIYNRFQYNVQRWDSIRYLILYKMGGMYADFDYESVKPLDSLLENVDCAFPLEPESHVSQHPKVVEYVLSNALMYSNPNNSFMEKIAKFIFTEETLGYQADTKELHVLYTTGPWKDMDLYNELPKEEKDKILLIPAKYVTPFGIKESREYLKNIKEKDVEIGKKLENLMKEAYAIHYFFNTWRREEPQ